MEPCGFAPLREVGSTHRPERAHEDEGQGQGQGQGQGHGLGLGLPIDAGKVIVGALVLGLGALLFALRDRLGAQAKTQGHGVTPLAYGVVGAILFAFGALYAVGGVV